MWSKAPLLRVELREAAPLPDVSWDFGLGDQWFPANTSIQTFQTSKFNPVVNFQLNLRVWKSFQRKNAPQGPPLFFFFQVRKSSSRIKRRKKKPRRALGFPFFGAITSVLKTQKMTRQEDGFLVGDRNLDPAILEAWRDSIGAPLE